MAKIPGWPLGINNVANDTAVPDSSLRDAVNVDLDASGKPRSRPGMTQVYPGSGCRSVYKYQQLVLFAEGSILKRLLPDYTAVDVYSGISEVAEITYAPVNNEVYWSDGSINGIVQADGTHREWGVPNPGGQPLVSQFAMGSLPAGKYCVAVTFEDDRGEESGSTMATLIELPVDSGITLSSIPQSSDAAAVVIYVTEPNGEILHKAASIPMGVTSYNILSLPGGKPLETQFMWKMYPGTIVRHDHGRMWVVSGKQLWYSEPLRYGLLRPAENFFSFPENITIFETVTDGAFVVSDKTYFLSGTDPAQMSQSIASPYRGIKGTGLQVAASLFDIDGLAGDVAYWYSEKGAMIGAPGGNVIPSFENRIALPDYDTGCTTLRESDGIRHLLTALTGSGDEAIFGVGDQVVTNIVRNGITIN